MELSDSDNYGTGAPNFCHGVPPHFDNRHSACPDRIEIIEAVPVLDGNKPAFPGAGMHTSQSAHLSRAAYALHDVEEHALVTARRRRVDEGRCRYLIQVLDRVAKVGDRAIAPACVPN